MIPLLIFTVIAVTLVDGAGAWLCKMRRINPQWLTLFCLPADVVAGAIAYRDFGSYLAAMAGALLLVLAQSTLGLWLTHLSHPYFWQTARRWSLPRYMGFCVACAPFVALPLGLLGGALAAWI